MKLQHQAFEDYVAGRGHRGRLSRLASALEKFLKAYLGFLNPVTRRFGHDLVSLMQEVIQADASFARFQPLVEEALSVPAVDEFVAHYLDRVPVPENVKLRTRLVATLFPFKTESTAVRDDLLSNNAPLLARLPHYERGFRALHGLEARPQGSRQTGS